MKKILNSIIVVSLLISFTLIGCSDDDDNTTQIKVTSMSVGDEAGNDIIALIEGDTKGSVVKIFPDEATNKDEYTFKYSSSNENIFTVDVNGVITAVGAGEAALRADAVNNSDMWATCVVKVETKVYPVVNINIPAEYKDFYLGVDKLFDLGSLVAVSPENATNPAIIYTSSDEMIATVNEYGEISTHALGDVKITIKAIDGSGITAECNLHVRNTVYTDLERIGWSVTTSHPYASDAAVVGAPECLIDDSALTTCLSLVKPGKTVGEITVPATDVVYFIIDMGKSQKFNFFKLRHRTNNTSVNLRVTKVSIFGSNDSKEFIEIISGASISNSVNEVTVDLPVMSTYRYFKMTYDEWASAGNTMQISDFNIGSIDFEK